MQSPFATPDQVLGLFKQSNAVLAQVASTSFEALEKQLELQLNTAKATLADATEASSQLWAIKDPQEFVAVAQQSVQPIAAKASGYARKAYAIQAQTNSDFARLAEQQVSDMNKSVAGFIHDLNKHAPAGTEGMVALAKSAFSASNTAYEAMHKASKQVVEMVEANMEAATKAGETAASSPKTNSRKRAGTE